MRRSKIARATLPSSRAGSEGFVANSAARARRCAIPSITHGDDAFHGTSPRRRCLRPVRTTCLVAASVVALATPARADDLPTIDSMHPPAVRVGSPGAGAKIERIAVEVRAKAVSWVTIEVKLPRFSFGVVPMDLPAGTRIVGMAVTTQDEKAWSQALAKDDAVRAYHRESDGALLTWESTSAGQDHISIVVGESARVELAVELPPLFALAIDPDHQTIARIEATVEGREHQQWLKHQTPVALDLRGIEAHVAEDPYPHANARIALVAGAPSRVASLVSERFSRPPGWGGDKMMIRRRMKLSRERITYCYERVAQWRKRPELEGTVNMQFVIERSGRVETAVANSTFPAEINTCLESVFKEWEFPELDTVVQVNYPITFSTWDD